ncbi:MAG TPA: PD-(D/E)XK nuclease family protein [Candidatus Omnitrophota bacterium]|nr:PD-(D/E)XK nuclease family protein [Candidatus Omnitrophota bacterium]
MSKNKILSVSFCESYIDKLVEHIETNYIKTGKDLSRLAIVFGGKRPALFIKQALAKRLKKSFYPPTFFTIDEFITGIVKKHEPFKPPQDLDACYLLYKITQEKAPQLLKKRQTFAQFLPWTREIMAFIEQLDLEDVAEKKLLNMQQNARIGYDVPKDINDLLQAIVKIRSAYHEELKKLNIYSRGFQYLRASQIVKDVSFEEFDQVLFCNFFYFHAAEEAVVKNLYDRGLATLIFQGDERKWPVLERISRHFECDILEGEKVDKPNFDLKLYSGFDVHAQVGHVREILKTIPQSDKTVVVLPQADHLIPLLTEIAVLQKDFNVSMGYPLKRSSLYTLFEFIFKAQLSKKDGRYYSKDYLKVMRHPFVKNLKFGKNSTVTRILVHKIEEILTGKEQTAISGSLFIDLEDIESLDDLYMMSVEVCERMGLKSGRKELEEILESIHEYFFREWEGVNTFSRFAKVLGDCLELLTHRSFMENYPLNLNIADKMFALRDEFEASGFSKERFELEEIFHIFEGKIGRELVSFLGSPLKGLQILGLFETRSLNFENVIVLDTNEGALPNLNLYEPLIPREVMISLNLDRLELEEEIQRYQFMRLISSAKNVHLVYQESKEKEKSRFIEELIWDEQKAKQKLDVFTPLGGNFTVNLSAPVKRIKKTTAIVKFLKQHTFSASSINRYLQNPMEFYYSYVLGLKETEDLLDEPDGRQVGSFIHELLEESYKPYINRKPVVDKKFRVRVENIFEKNFANTFERSMKTDSFLLKSVLIERLKRFLDNEQENSERGVAKLLFLESRCLDTIPLSCGNIKFQYIVDRIDEMKDGTIMITDYKTGAIDQMPRPLQTIEQMELSREHILENIRSFQVPLYYQYIAKQYKGKRVNAALYNLRTLDVKRFVDESMMNESERINEAFLRALDHVVSEILDPEVDFVEESELAY